jgi:hypothetical protein
MAKTLIPAATYTTAGTVNGSAFIVGTYAHRALLVLNVTAVAALAADTLDVFVDVSADGTKWLNACHFAQKLGNAAASTEFAILDPTNPGTSTIISTVDCAVSTVRPGALANFMRGRYTIVDGGGHGQSFAFSLMAYPQ